MQGPAVQAEGAVASVTAVEAPASTELRVLIHTLEQLQKLRLQTGERIRAVLHGRDGAAGTAAPGERSAGEVLDRIRAGEIDGPVPVLGRAYRAFSHEEEALTPVIVDVLSCHPAWPWLSQVRGIGPHLGGKLLSRLDVHRASTPSAFWAYCGLATVPGALYRCAACGRSVSVPAGFRVEPRHAPRGRRGVCEGGLVRQPQPVRVAQRRARGATTGFNPAAKVVCYLIGVSFLRTRSRYSPVYRRERARLDLARPEWPAARKHLAAMRKMEKLFLAHLWETWRDALGLPGGEPYPIAKQEREGWISPWEMVGEGEAGHGGRAGP
jgi:hypothetical protein